MLGSPTKQGLHDDLGRQFWWKLEDAGPDSGHSHRLNACFLRNPKRLTDSEVKVTFRVVVIDVTGRPGVYDVGLSGIALERVSSERYAAARSAFVADADGFPFLKKFALEHYGVHVVLSSAVSGWNTNTVALPHSIPALMYVGPGYCDLVLNPANVLKGFTGSDPTPWIKGVMVHELAHCLDVSRDMPSFTGRDIGTRSIAPGAAVSAVTLEQHLEAASRLPSQVWREALADSFTVGFWRMTEPSADQLITDLLEKRSSGDAAHYTSCWIEQAMQTPLPRSMPALLPWADTIRASSTCTL